MFNKDKMKKVILIETRANKIQKEREDKDIRKSYQEAVKQLKEEGKL